MQVTTARKAVTLLLSYLIFTKPLTEQHGTGLLLIAMGIILKMLPENKPPPRGTMANGGSKHEKSPLRGDSKLIDNGEDEEEGRPLV